MALCATLSSKTGCRAPLAASVFRDVVPPNRRRSVTARLELIDQRRKVLLQIGRILFRRLIVHPDRAILARTVIGIPHPLEVNILVQEVNAIAGLISRQLGDVLLFR